MLKVPPRFRIIRGSNSGNKITKLIKRFRKKDRILGGAEPLVYFSAGVADESGLLNLQLDGVGTPVSSHPENIESFGFEGLPNDFLTNEPVWRNARPVRNELLYCDDFNAASWTKSNITITEGVLDPFNTYLAVTVKADANFAFLRQFKFGLEIELPSMWIRRRSGTGDIILYGGSSGFDNVTSIIDSSWKLIKWGDQAGSTGEFRLSIYVQGDEVDIYCPQFEDSSGRSNISIPNDHIVTQGTGKLEVYSYENGNTIDGDGVVTQVKGDQLTTKPYLFFQPEFEQLCPYSNDFTNWFVRGTGTATFDQIGVKNVPNTASQITVNSLLNDVYQNVATGLTPDIECALRIFLKRVSTTGTLKVRNKEGALRGDWDIDLSSLSNNFELINADHPAVTVITEFKTDLNGDIGILFIGDGTDRTAIVGNAELYYNKKCSQINGIGPIFTTTTGETRGPISYSFSNLNHDNANGLYFFELIPHFSKDESIVLGVQKIIESLIYINSSGQFESQDSSGTLTADLYNFSPGEYIKIALAYSSSAELRSIFINGVQYEGSYTAPFIYGSMIRLFYECDFPCGIRNLLFYKNKTYDQLVSLAKELHGADLDFSYIFNSQFITVV